MKLKIISDGTPLGTHVLDAETGRELDGVYALTWSITFEGLADIQLKVRGVTVDVALEAVLLEEDTSLSDPVRHYHWSAPQP